MPQWVTWIVVVVISVVISVYIYIDSTSETGVHWVLRDANDSPIGTVIDVSAIDATTLIRVSDLGPALSADDRQFALNVGSQLIRENGTPVRVALKFRPATTVFFQGPTCGADGGQAYINSSGMLPALHGVGVGPTLGGSLGIYMINGPFVWDDGQYIQSQLSGEGCTLYPSYLSPRTFHPVEMLVSDIDQVFPPPFTLHRE